MSKSTSRVDKLNEITCQYRDGLNAQERTMYEEKLKVIGGEDPYDMTGSVWSDQEYLLPPVTHFDTMNYLLSFPAQYTCKNLKKYKELDAYKHFRSGLVREAKWRLINDKHLVIAKVLRSQRIIEEPLKPWILTDHTGIVIGSHCTCIVGIDDEICTHVAALLFAIEAIVHVWDSAEGVPISEIDFTAEKTVLDLVFEPVSAHSTLLRESNR